MKISLSYEERLVIRANRYNRKIMDRFDHLKSLKVPIESFPEDKLILRYQKERCLLLDKLDIILKEKTISYPRGIIGIVGNI